jgi:phenylalanyl-tRNA synthetase beta chain
VRAADLAKFPSVRRDLSLLVPAGITFSALASTVQNTGRDLVKSVNLFDVYAGKGLPEGTQSYAISIVLQDESKTLNDKQIDKTMQRILEAITAETGATLRAAATPQA